MEQAGQLKRCVLSLQLAADKREQSEKNLRNKLEKEVEALRLGSKQVRFLFQCLPFCYVESSSMVFFRALISGRVLERHLQSDLLKKLLL